MTELLVAPLLREADFAAMSDDWNRLAAATAGSTIFLGHEWCWAAWQWRKLDSTLYTLVVTRDDRAVAILPLVRRKTSFANWGAATILESLTVPDSQHAGVICAPEDNVAAAAAVAKFLANSVSDWDVVRLNRMQKAGSTDILESQLRDALGHVERLADDACFCAPLDGTWEAYYARRSRRLKKGNNLIANHLRKEFSAVRIQRTDNKAEAAEFAVRQAQVTELSALSWKNSTGTTLDQSGPREWWAALCNRTGGSGSVVLWTLELDGVLAATELQLDHNGVVSGLRADVNPAFQAYSPGTYLNWKVLEQLHGTGRYLYNMGPGRNSYKERWAESVVQLDRIECYSRTTKGRILWSWNVAIRPRLRSIRQWLKGRQSIAPGEPAFSSKVEANQQLAVHRAEQGP